MTGSGTLQGRRIELGLVVAGCIVIIALGVALIAVGHSAGTAMVGAILTSLATGVIAPTLYTFIAEIFPTDVGATGTSIADGGGRLGGVIAPFVFVPILFAAGSLAGGAFLIGMLMVSLLLILIGLLINTKGRTLEQSSL